MTRTPIGYIMPDAVASLAAGDERRIFPNPQGIAAKIMLAVYLDEAPTDTPAIDLAYSKINALGGTNDVNDDRIAGFLDAIDDALKILTGMGAKDAPYAALLADAGIEPTDQKAEEARQSRLSGL